MSVKKHVVNAKPNALLRLGCISVSSLKYLGVVRWPCAWGGDGASGYFYVLTIFTSHAADSVNEPRKGQ